MNDLLLNVRDVTKDFGGLRAIDRVSFHINTGEIFSIIGPNGAGKTTMFNLITGFLTTTAGDIAFKDETISGLKPYQVARKNIARTFQLTTLFEQNTVLDNLIIGQRATREAGVLHSIFGLQKKKDREEKTVEQAHELADFVGLAGHKYTPAALLPHGAQKQLSVGLALAAEPELVLLDEPVGGVDVDEIDILIDLIKRVREAGITVCLIEHKMSVVMNISDRILALNYGEKLIEDVPEVVCRDEAVIKSYLGDKYVVAS